MLLTIITASVAALTAIGATALRIARHRVGAGTASATTPTPSTAPMTAHVEISEPSAVSRDSASAFAAGASPTSQASPNVEDLSASEGVASTAEVTPAAEIMPAASPMPLAATPAGPATTLNDEPLTPGAEGTESSAGAPNPRVPADQRQSQDDVPALDIEIESPTLNTLTASRSASSAADTPGDLIVCYSEEVGQTSDGSTTRTIVITATGIALTATVSVLKVIRCRRLK